MQPPEGQARRQSLPLPARKRSMLILMAVTHLNRSPLRHWAYLTHQLASSWVISVGRYLRTQGKSEKRAFCSKDARCSCNVLMPTTVYLLMTAPVDFSYLLSYFSSNFLKTPRDHMYLGLKKIIIIIIIIIALEKYETIKIRFMFIRMHLKP